MSFGATLRTFSRAAATAGDGTVAMDSLLLMSIRWPALALHATRGQGNLVSSDIVCREGIQHLSTTNSSDWDRSRDIECRNASQLASIFAIGEWCSSMHSGTIVPDHQIAFTPDMAI